MLNILLAVDGSPSAVRATRGMSALANMALGSVTTRVLHLCYYPSC